MNDDELDPREAYPSIDKLMAEDDAEDPLIDNYNSERNDVEPN